MENNETKSDEIIEVQGMEQKTSKQGKVYFSVKTDKGNMSVFDKPIIDEIQKHIGQRIQVEVARNDRGFCNIRKYNSTINVEKMNVGTPAAKEIAREAYTQNKSTTMYVSYAKDLYIALLGLGDKCPDVPMGLAIELIKQAKEAFE